jgi:AraC-like DNA-binding protein
VISLTYAPPSLELAEFVSSFYLFETDDATIDELERADLAQFRVIIAGEGKVVFTDNSEQVIFPVSLFGPRSMASRVFATGPIKVFGAGLQPAGWAVLTGLEADKLSNKIVDASQVFGPGIIEVAGAIAAASDLDAMVRIASIFAATLRDRARDVPLWFTRAVDLWLESSLSPDLDDLVATTGLSRRQIDKLTKQLYGATPKLLVRKYRALRTASAVAAGKGEWQDFAADAYYDQSHCIKEVKEFTGVTPNAIKEETSRLTQLTFGRSRLAGSISKLAADS